MLTPAMKQQIESALARVTLTKFSSAKQMHEYQNAIVEGMKPGILAFSEKEARVKKAKEAAAAVRTQFKTDLITEWARAQGTNLKGCIIRVKGKKGALLICFVDTDGRVMCQPGDGKVWLGEYVFSPFGAETVICTSSIWQILINDKWVDVFKLASGAQ